MLALKQLVRTTLPPAVSPKRIDSGRDAPGVPRPNPVWQSLALKRAGIQPKLNVSQPADPQEREADRIADRVMRTPAPPSGDRGLPFSSTSWTKAEGKCAPCDEQEDKPQPSMQGDSASVSAVPSIVNEGLRSPGHPLEPRTREFMEGRFGQDFNQVRVHVNEESSAANQAVHAKAFTVGRDVVFGRGEYAPHTTSGLTLLAHELAHFGQYQTAATASREVIQRQAIEDDKDYDVVKFGDRGEANLFRLSIAYGVSFSEVKRLNAHLEKDNWTVRKGDLIKLPQGTLVKLKQSELTHGAGTAISSDSIPSEQRPDTSITAGPIPPDTSKTTAPKQTVMHQPTVTKQKPLVPATQTTATPSTATTLLAYGLLRKYASFLPGTEYYVPFSLDEEGLGKELARGYLRQPGVVRAVLDLTRWTDRDDVAFQFISHISNRDLVVFDRLTLVQLRAEMIDGIVTESEASEIYRIEAVLGLKSVSKPTIRKDKVPFYKQGNEKWKDRVLGETAKIGPKGCAVTAMSMAVSAVSGKSIDPSEMDAYLDKHSGYSGDNVYWSKAAQAGGLTAQRYVGFDVAVLDESLAAGKPCVISVNGNGHWVTVTAKRVDKNVPVYTIHDPATGKAAEMKLDDGALVGAKGAFSKKSGKYIITLGK